MTGIKNFEDVGSLLSDDPFVNTALMRQFGKDKVAAIIATISEGQFPVVEGTYFTVSIRNVRDFARELRVVMPNYTV